MTINNILRTDPNSHVLYRLSYKAEFCGLQQTPKLPFSFAVELDPLGNKHVHLDKQSLIGPLETKEIQELIVKTLENLIENGEFPE